MKLSTYAKTASQWWQAGQVDASHPPSGAIMGREAQPRATCVALSARVASAEHKADVPRQRCGGAWRSGGGCSDRDDRDGLNDERPKLTKLLTDARGGVIVVESQDRLTCFGYSAIAALLERAGRRVEGLSPSDTDADLADDLVAVITRLATHRYGRRRAARMQACVTQCIEQAEQMADT
jgi:putative resolvase